MSLLTTIIIVHSLLVEYGRYHDLFFILCKVLTNAISSYLVSNVPDGMIDAKIIDL